MENDKWLLHVVVELACRLWVEGQVLHVLWDNKNARLALNLEIMPKV